jgi:hypothetical protein
LTAERIAERVFQALKHPGIEHFLMRGKENEVLEAGRNFTKSRTLIVTLSLLVIIWYSLRESGYNV